MAELKSLKELKSENQKLTKISKDYINSILDDKSFVEMDAYLRGETFSDAPAGEGVVSGMGKINDESVMIFCQNPEVMQGALGKLNTKKIKKCIKQAAQNDLPLISVIDSKGVRLNEGMSVLNGFAKIMREAKKLQNLHIAIVKGSSYGLMSYLTMFADVVIMTEKSVMASTGPIIINAKSGLENKLDNFNGKARLSSGQCDILVKSDTELKDTIAKIIALSKDASENNDEPNRVSSKLNKTADTAVIIEEVLDKKSFVEFMKDFAPEVIVGLGGLDGMTVGIAATNPKINGGRLTREGAKKISRMLNICYNNNLPIINFVDSQGIVADIKQEKEGLIESIFSVMAGYLDLSAKISVITGSAVGASYVALASKGLEYNYVLGWEGADISVLDSVQSAELFYGDEIAKAKDRTKTAAAVAAQYKEEVTSIVNAAQDGLVDNIISPSDTRPYLIALLQNLER